MITSVILYESGAHGRTATIEGWDPSETIGGGWMRVLWIERSVWFVVCEGCYETYNDLEWTSEDSLPSYVTWEQYRESVLALAEAAPACTLCKAPALEQQQEAFH